MEFFGFSLLVLLNQRYRLQKAKALDAEADSDSTNDNHNSQGTWWKRKIEDIAVGANVVPLSCDVKLYLSKQCSPALRANAEDVVAEVCYLPSPYCMLDIHGQLQTSVQYFLRNITRLAKLFLFRHWAVNFNRQKVLMSDGGTVALDWAKVEVFSPDKPLLLGDSAPIVIMHHGLVGDSQSEYLYHLTWHLMHAGFRVVVMVARGCGGLELTSCSTFIGKKTSDVKACVTRVKNMYPNAKRFFLGFSLGAATTLKYVAQYDHDSTTDLTATMCVSPPWNMQLQGERKLVDLWSMMLALPLKAYILRHYKTLQLVREKYADLTLVKILSVKDLAELDSTLYHTYNGIAERDRYDFLQYRGGQTSNHPGQYETYSSVDEYYRDASPKHDAHLIKTPTLAVSAQDDPICCHTHCPTDPLKIGPGLVVVKSQYGGHLAFPEGVLPLTNAWTDRLAIAWFQKFL